MQMTSCYDLCMSSREICGTHSSRTVWRFFWKPLSIILLLFYGFPGVQAGWRFDVIGISFKPSFIQPGTLPLPIILSCR
jgi:hypothetical protein